MRKRLITSVVGLSILVLTVTACGMRLSRQGD
jgi:hypothetical protein